MKELQELHNFYVEGLKLDGKPEKGERKLIDDVVLIINEVLKPVSEEGSFS